MEHGGNEDEAIGALFYDAIEDAPNTVGAAEREARYARYRGRTVLGCTDDKPNDGGEKAPWKGVRQRI